MLVNHSNIQIICIVGRADLNFLSILLNNTGSRLIETKQDTHKRRFSCSVLSQKRMDLSSF